MRGGNWLVKTACTLHLSIYGVMLSHADILSSEEDDRNSSYVLVDLWKSLFLAFFPIERIFTHFSNAWFDSIQCFLPRCLGQKGPLIWEWFKCSTFHSFPLNPLVTFNRFHLHPVPNRPTMGGPCRISQRFDLRCNFSNWQPHHVTIMPPQRDIRQLFSATKMNFLWYFLSKWSFLLSWFRSEKLEKESAPQTF